MQNLFENNLDFNSVTKILFSLNLKQNTKEFMFNSLYDKMSTKQLKLILKTKAITERSISRSYYLQSNGTYIKDSNDNYIINRGRSQTTPEIHDSLWNDDISYIRYDTQDVYNVYTRGIDKNFVRKLRTSLNNIKISKNILDLIMRNLNVFVEDGFDALKWVSEFNAIYNAMNKYLPDIIFLRNNTEWMKKTGMYTNDIREILEFYSFSTNPIYYLTDWRFLSNTIVNKFSNYLLYLKDPTWVTKGIAIGIHIVNEILNAPIGNGYSPIQNMHDHGLNNWNSQLRNNFSTIGSLAQQAGQSGYNRFYNRIEWSVTDGWWTLPKLYLRAQGNRYWIDLSPGWSFN